MIVGEALNHRADLQKRVGQVQDRLQASVLVQEGDEPPESPEELLAEIRMVRQVSVSELQTQIDELAKSRRELDTQLQAHNWTTPLIE